MVSCLPVIFKAEEPPAGETETKTHMLLSYKMQDRNKVCEKKYFWLLACEKKQHFFTCTQTEAQSQEAGGLKERQMSI